ncbi:DUF1697 domain-containing protein [Krasilnikoviella flava]|uniref:Uncharacterized conserved protein, DUF1697 family n=1 Tax=Krasilnikoviella flava TaxID=526729 RepID=A0A1T5J334_9MICO|nr:DUF1697 domain-containing protein [Krasilnikoviella flava]SKC45820.1 Uncharacterized conserved protein, DUF1697 family [Krasilnikoviella flava]
MVTGPRSPTSVALLRGINVGGNHPIAMSDLAACFRDGGHGAVRTALQSGNVLLAADPASGPELEDAIERMLAARFGFAVPTLVRSRDELAATVAAAPPDHGSGALRSEVLFLKHPLTATEVLDRMPALRDGVDAVAPGPGAVYFSRVAAQARRTRITRLMALPVFRQMTVRTWRTTTCLLALLDEPLPP